MPNDTGAGSAEGCEMLHRVDDAASRLIGATPKHDLEIRILVANAITEFSE